MEWVLDWTSSVAFNAGFSFHMLTAIPLVGVLAAIKVLGETFKR